jgi:hypothetical protein
VYLEIYLNVKVVASEFTETWKLLSFIRWYTDRLSTHTPHTFHLCINNYHLKEDLCEVYRPAFLHTLGAFLQSMHCECLRSVQIYLFKQ